MKKLSFLLFLLMTSSGSLCLNGQTVTFQQEFNMPGQSGMHNAHIATYDGGIMSLISSFNSMNGVQCLTFIKTTATGNIQWTKRFSPVQPDFENFVQATDSGYFLCYRDYSTPQSAYQVIKLDTGGNVVFTKRIHVPPSYALIGAPDALAKNDGGFYVASTLFDTVTNVYLWHVFEINSSGNVLWSHCYNVNMGKGNYVAIDTCQNGDIVLAGTYFDPTTSLHSSVITRIAPGGSELWTQYYSAAGRPVGSAAIVSMPGDYLMLLSGTINPVSLQDEIVLMKTDGQGNELWTFTFSGNQTSVQPIALARGENNTSVIVGMMDVSGLIIKTDTTGLILCKRAYPTITFRSMDTLAGSVYSFLGNDPLFPRWILMTTNQCGVGCADTSLTVIKTPLTIQDLPNGANLPMPLTDTVNVLPVVFATVHTVPICSTIGIDEYGSNAHPNVYPVPASDVLHVQSAETILSAELVDIQGQSVKKIPVNSTVFECDVSGLANGMYMLRLTTDHTTSLQKVIILH